MAKFASFFLIGLKDGILDKIYSAGIADTSAVC